MKTQYSVSQEIRILHKINKKIIFYSCQASEKYVHFYTLNTWLGLLLHEFERRILGYNMSQFTLFCHPHLHKLTIAVLPKAVLEPPPPPPPPPRSSVLHPLVQKYHKLYLVWIFFGLTVVQSGWANLLIHCRVFVNHFRNWKIRDTHSEVSIWTDSLKIIM